jgi:hypothetical protein
VLRPLTGDFALLSDCACLGEDEQGRRVFCVRQLKAENETLDTACCTCRPGRSPSSARVMPDGEFEKDRADRRTPT